MNKFIENEELSKNEHFFFLNAFETTKQPMAISDYLTHKYIYANQAFLEYFEYKESELIGKSYVDLNILHNPEDDNYLINHLEDFGYVEEYPLVITTKLNEKKYVQVTMNLFTIEGKQYRYTILDDKTEVYNIEIERLETENERKIIQESFDTIINSTYHLIWIVDPVNFGILQYNTSIKEYFRKKGIDLDLGMTPDDLLNKKEKAQFWKDIYKRAINEGKISIEYKPEINNIWLYLTVSPLRINNKIMGISVFAEDITERINYQTALEISNKKLNLLFDQSIQAISKIGERRDSYTAGHQKRVQELSLAIARDMNLTDELIENLELGALIHDIGKIFVPSDILSKPGVISENEYNLLKDHSMQAYEIISDIDLPKIIPDMILQHHERLDGSGYPNGLKGDEICLEARIIAVADVVEAMNSHRPYRSALGIDAALNEIQQNSGTLYDIEVVDTCVRLFRENGFEFIN